MNFAHPRFTRSLPLLASVGLLISQARPAAAAQVFNQVAAAPAPAVAQTSGSETFTGHLVVSGRSGGREVVNSVIVARGVFNGVGRIVERPNLPSDPDNVSRDELVFAEGSLLIINMPLDASFTIDPQSCVARFTTHATTTVVGGSGRFSGASGSFTGTGTGHGLARRAPDGSCALDQAGLVEMDNITMSGTLSF